jgi:hypothetical protein
MWGREAGRAATTWPGRQTPDSVALRSSRTGRLIKRGDREMADDQRCQHSSQRWAYVFPYTEPAPVLQ